MNAIVPMVTADQLAGRIPTEADALAVAQWAEQVRQAALALPPIRRNGKLKDVADRLAVLEHLFKVQGAQLTATNRVAIERLRTLGCWGAEYEALPREPGGGDNTTTRTRAGSAKYAARQASGGLSEDTAARYSALGEHWNELHELLMEALDNTELSLRWALGHLEHVGVSSPDWLLVSCPSARRIHAEG